MSILDFPQVQSLSVDEKLELVDEIWKDVSSDLDLREVTQEERELLDKRWVQFLQKPSIALTVDQFKKELSALRG
jgi:putative addiction module component (TIGR02574 family)